MKKKSSYNIVIFIVILLVSLIVLYLSFYEGEYKNLNKLFKSLSKKYRFSEKDNRNLVLYKKICFISKDIDIVKNLTEYLEIKNYNVFNYMSVRCSYVKDCNKVFILDYLQPKYYSRFHHMKWRRMGREEHRVSCIYTGDTDLNVVKIKSIFSKFWNSVGTIQIPHHGDLKSFDKNILDDKYYWCPISVGKKNTYGHPSYKVIANILSQDSCPILVTEDISSGFIEYITC